MMERRVNLRWALVGVLVLTLSIRFLIATHFPVFGDEAYYLTWGRQLRAVYYDQPPMIGWWLWALSKVSLEPWFFRLPVVLLPVGIAAAGWRFLGAAHSERHERATIGALLVLTHVLFTLPMVMTTDVPLAFFSAILIGSLWIGVTRLDPEKSGLAFVLPFFSAGVALGLGLLSKYFILLVVPAYFVHALFFSSCRKRALQGGLVMLAAAAPFAVFYTYSNYQQCWVNFLFNFSSRHQGEGARAGTFVQFIQFQLLLASPFLFWAGLRSWRQLREAMRSPELSWLALSFVIPIGAFAVSALKYAQGLHWTLSFYPSFFFFMALALPLRSLKWWGGLTIACSFATSVVGAWILLSPAEPWIGKIRSAGEYQRLQNLPKLGPLLKEKLDRASSTLIVSDSYSEASTLSYLVGLPVFQFGNVGRFGRNDDLLVDLRQQDGLDIHFVSRSRKSIESATPFFSSTQIEDVEAQGVRYYVARMRQFDFEKYRQSILRTIYESYYQWPSRWPPGACFFSDTYFGVSERMSNELSP
jgi:hypothetical protein